MPTQNVYRHLIRTAVHKIGQEPDVLGVSRFAQTPGFIICATAASERR